jgi:hypothetical protein
VPASLTLPIHPATAFGLVFKLRDLRVLLFEVSFCSSHSPRAAMKPTLGTEGREGHQGIGICQEFNRPQ